MFNLPSSLQKTLENIGIESNELSQKQSSLLIKFDEFEQAADFRESILNQEQFHCYLISCPEKRTPIAVIDGVL